MHRLVRIAVAALLAVAAVSALALAADIKGWEKGSAYDKFYDAKETDSFKGRVEDIIDIVPMPGMAPGVGLVVRDKKDNKAETVHLGPKDFVKLDSIGLRKGDFVKVYGVWATVAGKDVVMASKIKREDEKQLKVRRTKDGMPWWSMSKEELDKETKAQED